MFLSQLRHAIMVEHSINPLHSWFSNRKAILFSTCPCIQTDPGVAVRSSPDASSCGRSVTAGVAVSCLAGSQRMAGVAVSCLAGSQRMAILSVESTRGKFFTCLEKPLGAPHTVDDEFAI